MNTDADVQLQCQNCAYVCVQEWRFCPACGLPTARAMSAMELALAEAVSTLARVRQECESAERVKKLYVDGIHQLNDVLVSGDLVGVGRGELLACSTTGLAVRILRRYNTWIAELRTEVAQLNMDLARVCGGRDACADDLQCQLDEESSGASIRKG
jgi:uncharacterized protein with PhoU and TrkA domain